MKTTAPQRLIHDPAIRASDPSVVDALSKLPPPPDLSEVALARVEARLLRPRVTTSRWVWPSMGMVGASALIAGMFLSRQPASVTPTPKPVVAQSPSPAAPSQYAWLPLSGGSRAVLVGLGAARPNGDHLTLESGRLLVSTRQHAVTVEASSTVVVVPARSVVEIEITGSRVRIAGYAGHAEVRWNGSDEVQVVASGTVVTSDRTTVLDPVRASEVAALFGEQDEPAVDSTEPAQPTRPAPHKKETAINRGSDARGREAHSALPTEGGRESPPLDEADLLARAVRHLRKDHDAEAALALIAEYDAKSPSGALETEFRRTQLQALLQLDRRAEALTVLDEMPMRGESGRGELRVVRGELRAAAGRCGEAIGDFDAVLLNEGDALAERALYGRASCRSRLGDPSAARADLERYLERYPEGRFARAARDALKGTH